MYSDPSPPPAKLYCRKCSLHKHKGLSGLLHNPCSQLALSANLIVQDGPDRWPVEGGARFRGVRIREVSL